METSENQQNISVTICPRCSEKLSKNTNFCTACGFSIIRQRKYLLNVKKESAWNDVKYLLTFYLILFISLLSLVIIPSIKNTLFGNEIVAWFNLTIVLFYFWYKNPGNNLIDKRPSLKKTFIIVIILLVAALTINIYYHKFILYLFNVELGNELDPYFDFEHSIYFLIFYDCILPAFSEELAFRHIIFEKFKKFISIKEAMVLTGLLFGILHLNFYSAPYLCFLGILLCWIKENSKLLGPCIIFHFLHNLFIVWLENQ